MNDEGVFINDKEKIISAYENKTNLKKEKTIHQEEITEEDIVEKQKLRNYFRSRYASFINSLKYDFKLKKINEENEKKRKESLVSKIREDMGLNNISSKVMEPTNAFKAKQVNRTEHPLKRSLSETNGFFLIFLNFLCVFFLKKKQRKLKKLS